MKQVFRTYIKSGFAPTVTRYAFYLNSKMQLSHITSQTCFLDEPEARVVTWAGDVSRQNAWDFNEADANDLKAVFKYLALLNPEDFKALYYTLKEHDEKAFPIIHSVLEEVQQLFNFN